MKHDINTKVKICKGTDETFDNSFLGLEGIVINHNVNNQTGNTENDPLHDVKIDLNTVSINHPKYDKEAFRIEPFWFEELQPISDNVLTK